MVAATGTATATVAMVGTITIAIVPTAMVIECAIAWLLSQQRRKVNDGNGNGRRQRGRCYGDVMGIRDGRRDGDGNGSRSNCWHDCIA